MDHKERIYHNHKVISFRGKIDLHNSIEFKQVLFESIEGKVDSLIVDIGDIHFLDSSGIGSLLLTLLRMKAKNGKFALVNVHENVERILHQTDLDETFTIYDSESEIP